MKTAVSTLILLVIYQAAHFPEVVARPPKKIIESFHVRSDIRYRLATTQVESVIRNVAGKAQKLDFIVTLPKEAFVVSFSIDVDGKVYNGEVKEKTAAKKLYEATVDRGESAGLVSQAARHSNIFEVSENVPHGSAAKFTLTYQEMLRRKFGVYNHEVHFNPGRAVNDFLIEVFIEETTPLKFVRTPALRKGSLITNETQAENRLTTIDRTSAETAHITYRPSVAEQGNATTPAVFVVEYDVEHSLRGEVVVVDGYFVHFFSPDLPSMPKDIVFVLDVSGSMYGQNIEQLKEAMLEILKDIQPDDRFNIITFSSGVERWGGLLARATREEIEKAKTFIPTIVARGGTDINSALLAGISELSDHEDNQRVKIIFFLTDGHPSVGITDSTEITQNVLIRNMKRSAMFCLAFGTGADYNLLTSICEQNSGFTRKIYVDQNAASQVEDMYSDVSRAIMKDMTVIYLPGSVDEYTVTNRKFPIIFNGSEVIISGKLADKVDLFQMEIQGFQKSGSLNLTMEVDDLNSLINGTNENQNTFLTIPRNLSGIVEKMWGYLTIKQYMKEKEIYAYNEDKVRDIDNKTLQMALKYNFVTPLTSMVVTKPESPEKPMELVLEDVYDSLQNSAIHHFFRGTTASYSGQGAKGHGQILNFNPGLQKSFNHGLPPTTTTPSRKSTTSSRPTAKHNSNTITEFLVPAIIAETSDMSICLAPKNVKNGKHNLIRSPNGSELDIETSCPDRKCTKFMVKSVILKFNGSIAEFSVNENGEWMYKSANVFSATRTNAKTITVSAGDFDVTAKWVEKKRSKLYTLGIKVKSAKGYKGLIGKVLNLSAKMANKWRNAKVPVECKDAATDISKSLKDKMIVLNLI